MSENIYITINHLEKYGGASYLKIGEILTLKKDLDNPYDDEAIATYNNQDILCGYVANSVGTVARGTYSAGRIFDKLETIAHCTIKFITEDILIAELHNYNS